MSLEFSRWWWCDGEGNVFFGTLQATLYQLSIFFLNAKACLSVVTAYTHPLMCDHLKLFAVIRPCRNNATKTFLNGQ